MSFISGLSSLVSGSTYSSAAPSQTTPADEPETSQTRASESTASSESTSGTSAAQAAPQTPIATSTASAETVVVATATQEASAAQPQPTGTSAPAQLESIELSTDQARALAEASVVSARHEAMLSDIKTANTEKARVTQVDEQNRQLAATNPTQGAYATPSLAAVSTTPSMAVQSIKMML